MRISELDELKKLERDALDDIASYNKTPAYSEEEWQRHEGAVYALELMVDRIRNAVDRLASRKDK